MTHSKAYDLAKKYYPTLWDKNDLQRLVDARKLYEWEYKEITGEDF